MKKGYPAKAKAQEPDKASPNLKGLPQHVPSAFKAFFSLKKKK